MGLTATANSKPRTPAPEGTHIATCVQVIDLGTQFSEFYQKDSHKVLIGWELPNEPNKDDENKPYLVWKRYTLSLNQKAALRQHLEAWRGRKFTAEELVAFHLKNILGKSCQLTLIHSDPQEGQVYANVAGIIGIPKNMPVPPQTHESIIFDIDEWDETTFAKFRTNLQEVILQSTEAKVKFPNRQPSTNGHQEHTNPVIPDDDIAF